MKKKGFTLIELLAVIVLLAIIMVISVSKIIDVIEKSERKAYEDSVNLMVHQAQMQYETNEITGEENKKIPEEGIVYIFGINDKKETYQTNIEEVGELKFKGDKPSSGTITLTKDKKVVVQNLVSKNKKWCAKKDGNTKNVTVGKATELGCAIEEEKEEIVKDKKACELEEETKDGKTYYYVDSVCDLYALSKNVSSGTNYSGKIVKLRNNLDMSKIDNNTKKYIEENKDYFTEEDLKINERFMPIGTSAKVFAGTFEGNSKTISNLTINRPTMDYVGLFGVNNGIIRGINIKGINVVGNNYVGGVVGTSSGTITEVVVEGNVTGEIYAGGVGCRTYGNISSIILNVNVTSKSGEAWSGYNAVSSSSIIENGTMTGPRAWTNTAYYSDKVVATSFGGTKYDGNALGNINGYESMVDTYIGGDDDGSGYYFDYDKSGKLVIKSTEKDPIEFKLKGSGTESDPYLIGSYEDWKMATIKADQVGAYFKITKDIDFTDKKFYMLGSYQNKFSGTLDGDNHTLTGIETKGGSYQGIIGYMDSVDAVVKNLKINKASMTNLTNYSGIVVGYLNKGTIKDVEVTNSKIISEFKDIESYIGGIAGYNASGIVEGVNVTNITVESGIKTGGISGHTSGIIRGINIKGINVVGNSYVGGIVGNNNGTITEVVVEGNVTGEIYAGGVGYRTYGNISSIILNVNVTSKSGEAWSGYNAVSSSSIIESGTMTGPRAWTNTAYYSDKVVATSFGGTKYDGNALGNINGYESMVDTYIGGDDDGSGYYFDYDKSGKLVIKSTEKDPIEFKLKGSGTESDPYLIGSYEDWKMATIKADQVGAYFKITKDIDFTDKKFYMLGSYQNKFSGTLDGDNHTLTGIETKGGSYQGIIGYMDSADAVVKNLKINKASMTNLTNYSGIVVGYLNKGTIKDVEVTNSKIISEFKDIESYIGGIAGYNASGIVEGVNVTNITVESGIKTGGISGHTSGIIRGINIKGINVVGNSYVGGIVGNNNGTITEVVVEGNVTGEIYAGGVGYRTYGNISSIILNVNVTSKSGEAWSGYNAVSSSSIIESGTMTGPRAWTNTTYYSDKVVATSFGGTKYSSNYINDLTYYDGLLDSSNKPIIESKYTGDVNGSGYFFDYGSDGKIRVVKAYAYDKGTADVDENYTMTKIVGTTDTTAPECTLDYVVPVSNGIRASFSCTDESGAPSITSMFDSTTSLAAKEYENIGTDKKGIVSGNTRSIVSTWTTNDPVSVPTKGKCYYFRYGGKDSSGNYSTYVTKSCYKGFSN